MCATEIGQLVVAMQGIKSGAAVSTTMKAIRTPGGRVRPPELPFSLVERTQLLARVSQAVDAFPFTLISAPAGSGKTVLASAWARQPGRTYPVWLTVTSRDERPVVFWSHVRFALTYIGAMSADIGPVIAHDAADMGDMDAVAEQILQLDRPVVLVLDATDRLQHGAVFDQLGQLLDSTCGRLRVLMTTRVDPPMPLHRYRLEGTLAEIRLDDLAFTGAEVRAALDIDDATALDAMTKQVLDRTEGWAAGVRLAALALTTHEDAAALYGLAADYLRAEVLDKLADPDRDFLVRTSLVDEMTPGLGAVLAERADADELLRRLSHGNAFVLPVHERPGCYRVHPLFRELLSAQLARTPHTVIRDLCRRAADWFGAHGQLASAVRHAAAVGDWTSAAAFVVTGLGVGDLMLPTPEGRAVAAHLSAMPDLDSPDVQLVRAALAVGQGDLELARTCLARCGASASASADWSLSSAVVAARLSDRAGATADALTAARQARSGLAGLDHRPEARLHILNALASSAEGTAQLRAGDLDAACSALGDAVRSAAAGESDELRLRCLAALALAEVCRGHLSRGLGLADSAERLTEQCAVAGTLRPAATHLAQAWVALERQDLARAQRSLDRAGRLDETCDDTLMSSLSSLLRARLMRDRGDTVGARCILGNPDRQIGWLRRYVDAEAAGVGLLASVAELEPHHRAGRRPDGSRHRLPVQTRSQRVQELLERAQTQCVAGDVRAGRSEVAKALSLAQRERIRRPFAHVPAPIRAMIRNDRDLRSQAGWLRPEQTATRHTAAATDPAPILEDLSQRELEVLRHLSALLTTEEIAAEMFISVNTVKTHVRKILGKLSVSRRNDAVRRAWELNLV
jgi:LuxR family maltose regulon positive regulatory protein